MSGKADAVIKPLVASIALTLLSVGAMSCGGGAATQSASVASGRSSDIAGGSGSSIPSVKTTSANGSANADPDQDNDPGAVHDSAKQDSFLDFGPEASVADKDAVKALLRSYYIAAIAGDGAKACSMIVPSLAKAVPEDYGGTSSPPYSRGTTCPTVLSRMFEHFHGRLASYLKRMKMTWLRVNATYGLAVLSFAGMPEREIMVAREGRAWKVGALLDTLVP